MDSLIDFRFDAAPLPVRDLTHAGVGRALWLTVAAVVLTVGVLLAADAAGVSLAPSPAFFAAGLL